MISSEKLHRVSKKRDTFINGNRGAKMEKKISYKNVSCVYKFLIAKIYK